MTETHDIFRFPDDALRRGAEVDLLILDVDGVLTDGRLHYSDAGVETRSFHAQDGAAIKMLQAAGVPVAIISGRTSGAVARRAAELDIAHLYQGAQDKSGALDALRRVTAIGPGRMAHVGDDIPDLALFDRVGFRVSVPGAHPMVLARADYVTVALPGAGSVREVCNLILVAKGLWRDAVANLAGR